MMHTTLNLQKRAQTELNQTDVVTPFYNNEILNNRKSEMSQAYKIIKLMNQNHQITIKYSHIKIVLAINSIFNLVQKLQQTTIFKYQKILFQNLSYCYNINRHQQQHHEFLCNKQLQLIQGIMRLKKYHVKISKQFLHNLSYQLLLKRKLNKVFNRINKQVYENKLIGISYLFIYSKKEKSLLDNLSYFYYQKQIKNQDKLAIKFASSTLFIKALNNKVLQYQISFFIKLCGQGESKIFQLFQQQDYSISNSKIKSEEFEFAEKRLNGICLLNSVIKKIFHNYFLTLKLQDLNNQNRRVSIKSSIFNSESGILRRLIKHGESIMELYQSTNDTEQSKKEQEQDDIILQKKKTMYQTYHPQPLLIKRRISILQSSEKFVITKRQSLDLKQIKIQKQKSNFLWIALICLILGGGLMILCFYL